jgi:hypothetical protein
MAQTLEGSCHCGAVRFRFESHTPYPFNYCYCSVCRKTAGGGGFAINIMGQAATLAVEGEEHLAAYHAVIDGHESEAARHFCAKCGSHLWLSDSRWPDWFYPLASAIDSDLPTAPDRVHLMLGSKPGWVPVPPEGPTERHFDGYPEESIEAWHRKRGLYQD